MQPHTILQNWNIPHVLSVKLLSDGIFNTSYAVRAGDDLYILQRLHQLIQNPRFTNTYLHITEHLSRCGLAHQGLLLNRSGALTMRDGPHTWRLLRAIPGRVYQQAKNARMARQAGYQLGKTHRALMSFPGKLSAPITMFQYKKVFAVLKSHERAFRRARDPAVFEIASILRATFPHYFLPAHLPRRVIHTDPKISNFVFDTQGRARAMIDFDTVQRLSPLYDIGDALRSISGKLEDDPNNTWNARNERAFLRGYFTAAPHYLSARERALIPQATSLIILGLAARFLNDYIDDEYFGWNRARFPNRKAANLARARGQLRLWQDFAKKKGLPLGDSDC